MSTWLRQHWQTFTLTLARLYGSEYRLAFFGAPDCLALLVFAAMLGWLGAYVSVSRHLAEIEPR